MTNCTPETVLFPVCRKRRIEAAFDGGDVTSNGGVLLLRQADRRLGLTAAVARRLGDRRQRGKVRHRFVDIAHIADLHRRLSFVKNRNREARTSVSWRLTRPLRGVAHLGALISGRAH